MGYTWLVPGSALGISRMTRRGLFAWLAGATALPIVSVVAKAGPYQLATMPMTAEQLDRMYPVFTYCPNISDGTTW